jgi:CheY-like chemotaxis protein
LFDLVLCDLFMPKWDGLETIQELRRGCPRLKVVAMSGLAGAGGLLRAARVVGADAVLQKPFSGQQLRAVLEQCLPPAPANPPLLC